MVGRIIVIGCISIAYIICMIKVNSFGERHFGEETSSYIITMGLEIIVMLLFVFLTPKLPYIGELVGTASVFFILGPYGCSIYKTSKDEMLDGPGAFFDPYSMIVMGVSGIACYVVATIMGM